MSVYFWYPTAAPYLGLLMIASLTLASLGLAARWMLVVATVTNLLFLGPLQLYSGSRPHNLCWWILLGLCFAPHIGYWGVQNLRSRPNYLSTPSWPFDYGRILIALTFLGAAYAKLSYTGWKWADGNTLQTWGVLNHFWHGAPLGIWIAHHFWLCKLGSWLVLMAEILCGFAIFIRRLRVPLLVFCLGFLVNIYLWLGITFGPFGLTSLILFPWARWLDRPENTKPIPNPKLGLFFVSLVVILQTTAIFCRTKAWPLTDFPMYANYKALEGRRFFWLATETAGELRPVNEEWGREAHLFLTEKDVQGKVIAKRHLSRLGLTTDTARLMSTRVKTGPDRVPIFIHRQHSWSEL